MVDNPTQSASGQSNQNPTQNNKDNKSSKASTGNGSRSKRNNRGKKGDKSKKSGSKFEGACTDMNGHVFETHAECTSPGQFTRTCEELYRHVTTKYKDGHDIGRVIRNLAMWDIMSVQPQDMPDYDARTKLEQKLWDKEVEIFSERKRRFQANLHSLFQIIWGQCSKLMISHMKTLEEWSARYDTSDCVWLLKEIQRAAAHFEAKKYVYLAVAEVHTLFYGVKQHTTMTNEEYHTRFCQILKMFEHYDTELGMDRVLVHQAMKQDGKPESYIDRAIVGGVQWKKYAGIAQQRFFAAIFLRNACTKRYGSLFCSLENAYARKANQFPDTVAEAYSLLLTYKKEADHDQPGSRSRTTSAQRDKENVIPNGDNKDDAYAFVQEGSPSTVGANTGDCNLNIDLDAELPLRIYLMM